MVDLVTANPGSGGAGFAVDFDGAANWPAGKLVWGALHGTYIFVNDADGARVPVKPIGPRGSLTNRGIALTLGGTSQQIAASNASRQFLLVANPSSETESVFVNFTSAAAADQTSVEILPGGSFLMQTPGFVSTEAINVVAATTNHKIICKEG